MKNTITVLTACLCIFFCGCKIITEKENYDAMKTVNYVDLNRFMGDWFVIANIPTIIEKGATNAKESYRLNREGVIETTFTFNKGSADGKLKKYFPKGFVYNKQTNAEWRMQFLWPFKLPFLIIQLAEDYSYTVIGYPSKKYVWIMAREPKMDDDLLKNIIHKLEEIGYDKSKIKMVPQNWD